MILPPTVAQKSVKVLLGVGIGEDLRFKTRQGPNMSEIIISKLPCTSNSFFHKNL